MLKYLYHFAFAYTFIKNNALEQVLFHACFWYISWYTVNKKIVYSNATAFTFPRKKRHCWNATGEAPWTRDNLGTWRDTFKELR